MFLSFENNWSCAQQSSDLYKKVKDEQKLVKNNQTEYILWFNATLVDSSYHATKQNNTNYKLETKSSYVMIKHLKYNKNMNMYLQFIDH